jgi:P-type Mg2+ transporter
VESLSTQSLVIFVIRTRRIPFFRSRPSTPLIVSTAICVAIGLALPYSPLAHVLGFTALPLSFLGAVVAMIVVYLGLVELGKRFFYRTCAEGSPLAHPRREPDKRIDHRASRWSTRKGPERGIAENSA